MVSIARKRVKLDENVKGSYPYWINFYTEPPTYKVTLQEIEDCVSERLKILKTIDNLSKLAPKRDKKFNEVLQGQLNGLNNFYGLGKRSTLSPKQLFDARKYDHISHFLLRILFCQNTELRKFYVSRETDLFRQRFMEANLDTQTLQDCLKYYGYDYEILDATTCLDMHDNINWMSHHKTKYSGITFKLRFQEALDLVRNRLVFLYQGYAYVTINDMLSVFANDFRMKLSHELAKMHQEMYSVDEPRLLQRLESLKDQFLEKEKKRTTAENLEADFNRLHIEDIEDFSKSLYPPCMQTIHEGLRRDHHLKHYGRLYYSLYLKGAGLPLDEAVEFFRSELGLHNPDKFQKEYSYTIRHIYGKEGRRTAMSPYSCQKIVNNNPPGPSDMHGCPFKHYDDKNLRAMLVRFGINEEAKVEEILKLAKQENNVSGACSSYFCAKNETANPATMIFHPNQFFKESKKLKYAPQLAAASANDTVVYDESSQLSDTSLLDTSKLLHDDSVVSNIEDEPMKSE